jgi:hypothetical protein
MLFGKVMLRSQESSDLGFHIYKGVSVEKAMIQRSQIRPNPTKFNPNETPNKIRAKFFSFVFNNLQLGKTTDHAV